MPQRVVMNVPGANPCSLNFIPPAKKHKPRTYVYGPSQLSLGNRIGRSQGEKLTNTIDEEAWFWVSKRCSGIGERGGWRKKFRLTEITQDGTNEGRLDDTELTFHERNDLQNRLSRRGADT